MLFTKEPDKETTLKNPLEFISSSPGLQIPTSPTKWWLCSLLVQTCFMTSQSPTAGRAASCPACFASHKTLSVSQMVIILAEEQGEIIVADFPHFNLFSQSVSIDYLACYWPVQFLFMLSWCSPSSTCNSCLLCNKNLKAVGLCLLVSQNKLLFLIHMIIVHIYQL